jgi:hypothetical protein
MEASGQLYALAALPLEKEVPVLIECCGEEKRFLPLSIPQSEMES